MVQLKKWNQTKSALRAVLLFLGLWMLLLNALTPYLVDDYAYMFSYVDRERVHTLADVYHSMIAHSHTMNGRVISHALEQIFLLLPKAVFNCCNALVFAWVISSAYSLCNYGRAHNAALCLLLFMAYWVFIPVFGQVNLWQVGALNYLWAMAYTLLFLQPFCSMYLGAQGGYLRAYDRLGRRLLFLPLAFIYGMYSELCSLVGLLMAAGVLLVSGREKRRENRWLLLPLLLAAAGFVLMMRMPATLQNKVGQYSFPDILANLDLMTERLWTYFLPLCAVWTVLMLLACRQRVEQKRRVASLGFFLGAIAANYALAFARYQPDRCGCITGLFLILACMLLLAELLDGRTGEGCRCLLCVLTVMFALRFAAGNLDIVRCGYYGLVRDNWAAEQIAAGQKEIVLERIPAQTPYSPAYGIKDLDLKDFSSWPNWVMAKYYGAELVIGRAEA